MCQLEHSSELTIPLDNYRYKVNTNLAGVVPNINRMVAVVQLPSK